MALAKTTRPRIHDVLPRPRLFRRLEGRRPLTWVWGPPGSGKTALVASYLEARRVPGLWYHLDAGDADLATFYRLLGEAAGGRRGGPLAAAAGPPQVVAREFFRALWARLELPFVLVLDNYQDVAPGAALHDVVREAVAQLPPGGRVVVTSRAAPPAAFAGLRAGRALAEVGWADLRLTAAETRGLVRRLAPAFPPRLVSALHARAEGWAAGLVLMLQDRRSLADERRRTPDSIFDYFAAEILARADPETQDVLLRTAFLPRLTGAMAEALTGRPGDGRVLAALHRQNCFTVQHARPEAVYEFHPLFRAFLLRRAHVVLPRERRAEIQRQAARLLADQGQLDDAAALLRSAREWAGLACHVETHAPRLAAQGRLRTVEEWVGAIPDEIVTERPWLLYWRGAGRRARDPGASRRDFEAALSGFRGAGDATGAYLGWTAAVETFPLEREDFRPLEAWIVRFEDLLRQFPAFPSREVETRVAGGMLVALLYCRPHHKEIKVWARRALDLAETAGDRALRLDTTVHVLAYQVLMGDFDAATVLADDLRTLAAGAGVPPLGRVAAGLGIGRLEWLTGVFAAARSTLEGALALARANGVGALAHTILCELAMTALSAGDRPLARRWLGEIRRDLTRLSRANRAYYRFVVGWDALLAGAVATAAAEHEAVVAGYWECGLPASQFLAHLFAAQTLEAAGTPGAAVHLAQAAHLAQEMDGPMFVFMARLVEAELEARRGDDGRAIQALAAALPIGRARGYVNTWMWRPATMADLAARALDADLEPEYVRRLIRARGLVPGEPSLHVETWPWPVKVFTLGRFEVLLDERPLEFAGKVQKKPVALLQALVALGGQKVREDRLTELLWPDADGDAAHQALSVTLHRLRRLLGHDRALVRNNGFITLAPDHCWVDAWAVEQTLARAEAAIARSPVRDHEWASSVRWTDRAVALYRGEFLAGDATLPSAAPVNARLKERLLRQLRKIGHVWEGVGDWEEAAECYERAVAINDCAEEFYRRLMAAYQRLDRRADAIHAYQRCRKALSSVLGIGPSAETEALYRTLQAHGC